jgi:hypothetical protein
MKALQPNLNLEDKDLMEKLLSAGHLEQRFAQRLQTVLLRARGKQTGGIADFLGIHQSTVSLYINRYNTLGINALLHDKTRKPGKEPVSQGIKTRFAAWHATRNPRAKPIGAAGHWRGVPAYRIPAQARYYANTV